MDTIPREMGDDIVHALMVIGLIILIVLAALSFLQWIYVKVNLGG